MKGAVILILMLVIASTFPLTVSADLFDQARQSVNLNVGRADSSGVSIRGGANLNAGLRSNTTTLLRGQTSIGGGCGAFDFATSFQHIFEEVPGILEGMATNVVEGLPLLVLCYLSPTACDVAKHWMAISNVLLQSRTASCQATQNAMAYGGLRLRGGEIAQCLEAEASAGHSISAALQTCTGDLTSVRRPDGTPGIEANLVKDTLAAAGAPEEIHALAKSLLGEVTLRADNGRLGAQQSRPAAALQARYEAHREASNAALRQAVQEVRDTGQVSDATLRAIAVPGQAMPQAALEALRYLQQGQEVRYESLLSKMSTGMAISRLTWECGELAEQLAASIEANQQLSDESRRLLEKRLDGLRRDLANVAARKEAVERHYQPALDALLNEYTGVMDAATKAGLRAPTVSVPAMPYRRQPPGGYTK